MSSLNHPSIATIFDVDEVDGQKFLVLEYLAATHITHTDSIEGSVRHP